MSANIEAFITRIAYRQIENSRTVLQNVAEIREELAKVEEFANEGNAGVAAALLRILSGDIKRMVKSLPTDCTLTQAAEHIPK